MSRFFIHEWSSWLPNCFSHSILVSFSRSTLLYIKLINTKKSPSSEESTNIIILSCTQFYVKLTWLIYFYKCYYGNPNYILLLIIVERNLGGTELVFA